MAEVVTFVKATSEVTVFISPPGNEVITDKDSGDEENVHLRNLSGNQIIADATVATARFSAPPRRDECKLKLRNWVKENLPQSVEELKHIVIRLGADYTRPLNKVFELFLDDTAIKHLTAETVKYAFQFGNHNFSLYLLRKCKHLLPN